MAILNEDGLIVKAQGKGTMVTPPLQSAICDTITNPLISLCKKQITATHISYNYASPTEIARSKLSLTESDIVLACNCVYKADDVNSGYSFIQIPSQYFKALNLNTSDTNSIKEIITEGIFNNTSQSDIMIKLIYANDIEVEFLGVSPDTPLLLMESLLLDEILNPFARCKFHFIPEYYHLTFSIK